MLSLVEKCGVTGNIVRFESPRFERSTPARTMAARAKFNDQLFVPHPWNTCKFKHGTSV